MEQLSLIYPPSARSLGSKISRELGTLAVDIEVPRFSSGEGKGVIKESIRGDDVFIISDVTEHHLMYEAFGSIRPLSPDEHFADLKRIIMALSGKAKRITVIMPFLYESRQHKRGGRESLDCAVALQELQAMGVDNLITLDVHHAEVMNAVPMMGFESIMPTYQFMKAFLEVYKGSLKDIICIAPDEGATSRAVNLANSLKCDMAMYYKRRDCTRIVDGKNPIVDHVYLGPEISGRTAVIVDDMIASGDSVIETAKDLKERGASKVYVYATFGLFTKGLDRINDMYSKSIIDGIFTTDSIYRSDELLVQSWYYQVPVAEYLSEIIHRIHTDQSISPILNPTTKIVDLCAAYEL